MRRSAVAVVPLVGALVFAACSDRDSTNSRGPLTAPATTSFTILPGTTCNFEAIETAAQAYFSASSNVLFASPNGVLAIGEQMEAAHNTGHLADATAYGFVMLREVAKDRLTSRVKPGSTAAGVAFVIDVLRCTTLKFPSATVTSPDVKQDFLNNLGLILDAGIFEVRGGSGDATTPAAALLSVGGVRTLAAPHWGVEATGGTWPTDGHFLVYGYPTFDASTIIDAATNLNTNGPSTYNSFELGTIPDSHPKGPALLVGICFSSVTGTTAANRLIHNNAELFANTPPSALCSLTTASAEAGGWYRRTLARAASWIAPQAANAAVLDGEDFIGGQPSSWSPISTAKIVGTNVGTSFTTPPVNIAVGATMPVVVRAMTNGVPVPGVSVTLNVINNNGVPAGAIIVGASTVSTNSDGYAIFNIGLGKAGGYNLVARGAFLEGVGTNGVVSVRFNVKNH